MAGNPRTSRGSSSNSCSQHVVPLPLLPASPRRTSAPSSRAHSSDRYASACCRGRGGNDVMLFLCQVSFKLQFSPPSSSARPRRSYYVSLPRTHWGLQGHAASVAAEVVTRFLRHPTGFPLSWTPSPLGTEGGCRGSQQGPESEVSPSRPPPSGASGSGWPGRARSRFPVWARELEDEAATGWGGCRAQRSTLAKGRRKGDCPPKVAQSTV